MARALLYALLAAGALAIALGSLARPLTGPAESRALEVAAASAGVYASLRTINAAISLIQETEVGAQFVASGSVRPLAWLDPVDDTIERVAAVIFWIALAAGLMSLALAPLSTLGWAVLAAAFALRCATCALSPATVSGEGREPNRLLRRGERGLFVLGFGFILLPLVLWGGLEAGERLTQDRWDAAIAELSSVEEAAEPVVAPYGAAPDGGEEGGVWEAIRDGAGGVRGVVVGFYEAAIVLREDAESLFLALLTISGIFLLRMIVLPAALLWALLALVRRLI